MNKYIFMMIDHNNNNIIRNSKINASETEPSTSLLTIKLLKKAVIAVIKNWDTEPLFKSYINNECTYIDRIVQAWNENKY